jgi:hypothetical protein
MAHLSWWPAVKAQTAKGAVGGTVGIAVVDDRQGVKTKEDQMDQPDLASSAGPAPDPVVLASTRHRLHGIGECLMAGPQRRAGGRFTLRVTPGGFATTGEPALRLDGTDLVVDESRRVAVGGTFAQ